MQLGFQIPTLKYYPDFCEKSKVNTTTMPQENELLGSAKPGVQLYCGGFQHISGFVVQCYIWSFQFSNILGLRVLHIVFVHVILLGLFIFFFVYYCSFTSLLYFPMSVYFFHLSFILFYKLQFLFIPFAIYKFGQKKTMTIINRSCSLTMYYLIQLDTKK